MSLNFRTRFEEMKENNPTSSDQSEFQSKAYEVSYPEEGHVRNICFVWRDGRRVFLNYSYLVSGEYSPAENTITLAFTSQTYVLKGVNLESLFYDTMQQFVRQIVCMDTRYNIIGENEKSVVNNIEIKKEEP